MFHYLQGKLVEKSPMLAVLDVHGVGYEVHIPLSTYSQLPQLGHDVKLLTHFIVREDAQQLQGFFTEDERELFRMLISVSGVGPKVATTALSGLPMTELREALASGDIPVLTSISGIGKKTAERLVVELKEKMVLERRAAASPGSPQSGGRVLEDSLQALVSLGYKKIDAKAAVEKAMKDKNAQTLSVEDLIRASLKHI
ncbi:MAG: Holliday junction branch migration protein RuvA [Candidatus Omnitrophica bacterium]|nr:Holliday junction branch migration protein RuvA [Candidatus Omnitrophota bacterium]